MSRVLLVETKDLHKNQKIRDEIHNLVDKAYYADPIKYKMDNAMAYLDNLVPNKGRIENYNIQYSHFY